MRSKILVAKTAGAILAVMLVLSACGSDATEPTPPGPPPPPPSPTPADIVVISGGEQVGTAGLPLMHLLEARVLADGGSGLAAVHVGWEAMPSSGMVQPSALVTDGDGNASATWTLAPVAGPQTARATVTSGASVLSVDFTATAFVDLTIVSDLPAIYRGNPVDVALVAAGGAGPPFSWRVASGALPPGLELSADGILAGTPTDTDAYAFELAVADATGGSITRAFEALICDPPLELSVGATALIPLPVDSRCPLVLPGVQGRRYEIGLMGREPVARDVAEQLRLVTRVPAAGAAVSAGGSTIGSARTPTAPAVMKLDLLGSGHVSDLARRAELVSSLRPRAVAAPAPLLVDLGPPPTEIEFYKAREGGILARATLRTTSAEFAYYEETGTAEGGFRASDEAVQAILGFYSAHGRPLIESIGGLAPDVGVEIFADASGQPRVVPAGDLDENGRIIIIQLLDTGAGIGAFVSDFCDRQPRPEHALPGVQSCAASNEGEFIYLGPLVSLFPEFFPSAVVHEATHLASVGHGMFGQGGFEPIWIEEGIAYLVGEKASRAALGIGDGEELRADQLYAPPQPGINTEGILQILDLATHYLDATPRAGIFGNVPELGFSQFQGGAWLFLRHVLDLYVAGGGTETDFLRSMVAEQSGVAGLEAITGRSLADLLAEYVAGLAVGTRPAARTASPYRYRSYDLQAVTAGRYIPDATWPYPEVVGAFANGEWTIDAFHGGPVYFEFGSGSQSMEIRVTDGIGGSVQSAENVILSVSRIE